MKYSSSDCPW